MINNIIYLIFLLSIQICKSRCNISNLVEDNDIINKNEDVTNDNLYLFNNITLQNLAMVYPSNQCKCQQRTLFFKYPKFIEINNNNNNKFNVTEVKIENKEFFVVANYNTRWKIIKEIIKNNNLIYLSNKNYTNLYWINDVKLNEKMFNLNKYQKFNHFTSTKEISRKELLYINYDVMNKLFPDDYNYIPKTYTYKNFKELIKNYNISKDNLWLVKPDFGHSGKGIHFLKNINDVKEGDIVTKYISNPLLINKKKFDFRIYILVTGHDPLKAYIFNEGLVRISSEEYDLDLNDLNNLFKHLTNTSINKKKKNYKYENLVMSIKESKKYLEQTYKLDFKKLWNEMKDISIKTLISMNDKELNKENK